MTSKVLLKINFNNLEINDIDLTINNNEDNNSNFIKKLNLNEAISYFYDNKNQVLFCLFSNGILCRINFVKNA